MRDAATTIKARAIKADYADLMPRLNAVGELCSQIAGELSHAVDALRVNADDRGVVHLAAFTLQRVGWLAERAESIATGSIAQWRGGSAEAWILDPGVLEAVKAAGESDHG